MNTLEIYQVKFTTRKFFNNVYPEIYSINESLASYISEHSNLMLANALIDEINFVLQGDKLWGGWDTLGLMVAKITASETKIYDDFEAGHNENIAPGCILPTIDFKIIVAAWLDFLKNNLSNQPSLA